MPNPARRIALSALAALLLAAAAAPARATNPYVVRLLEPQHGAGATGSFPEGFAAAGGLAYFAAGLRGEGREIWRTDGTAAGTFVLGDLCPGPCGTSVERAVAAGDRMAFFVRSGSADRAQLWSSNGTVEGTLCLIADLDHFSMRVLGSADGEVVVFQTDLPGAEGLWASDGTPEGTLRIRPLPPRGGFLLEHLAFDDGFLFTVDDGVAGHELWRTDGTTGGTFQLRDVAPGPAGSFPRLLTPVGNLVYFVANAELWRTDGTPGGTVRVAQPSAGGAPLPLDRLTAVGDRLFFIAGEGDTDPALWVSDGTAEGTRLLASLRRSNFVVEIGDLVAGGDRAWVVTGEGLLGSVLWVSDGTPAGTHAAVEGVSVLPLLDFEPEQGFLKPLGDRVVFRSDGGVQDDWEPWVTDGTPGGTRRLVDLCPGECSGDAEGFWPHTGLVYFRGRSGPGSDALWRTDGTPAGTFALLDPCAGSPGTCSVEPAPLAEWQGELYVSTGFQTPLWKTDGTLAGTVRLQGEAGTTGAGAVEAGNRLLFGGWDHRAGEEPWSTDGTLDGTRLLRDLDVVAGTSSFLLDAVSFSGQLLQISTDGSFDWQLWSSDGTAPGTVDLVDDQPSLGTAQLVAGVRTAGDRAYFVAEGSLPASDDLNLWITDGTHAGTRPLTDFDFGGPRIRRGNATLGTLGGRIFFFAEDERSRLWVSDGSVDGTLPLLPLNGHQPLVPPGEAQPALAGVAGGRLVFAATPNQIGPTRVWRSDGTAGGTRPLGPADALSPTAFTGAGGRLFFSAGFFRLWVTDGTDAGTRALTEAFAEPPVALAAAGGRLYFAADDGQSGEELWTSDGTPAGTRRVADLHPAGSSRPREIRDLGQGRIVFAADDGVHGRELWTSDGTAAGTRLVIDLVPGIHDSSPAELAIAGDRVYFAAHETLHGREIWTSDGTAAGTRLLADLAPGPESADPRGLTVAGDRIFFHASSDRLARTLWAYVWRGAPPSALPAAPAGLTTNGPVEPTVVELSWQDRSTDEAFYVIESTWSGSPWQPIAYLPPDTREHEVFLVDQRPSSFRVRAENGAGASAPSNEVSATRVPPAGPCVPDEATLCLLQDRFALRVAWHDPLSGDTGTGRPAPFPGSGRTGTFWFFDPDNVELIVKALDGRGVNGAFWSFYGALSNVEYWVTVVDTERRRSRTYHNTPGEICGVGDTGAFPAPLGSPVTSPAVARTARKARALPRPGAAGACQPGPETLCLLDGRLKVEVAWNDHHNGGSGPGRAVPGTDAAGYFWFFNPDNVEMVVKALDGTPVNGHLWVFWGALTDAEYTITVTDTETGVPVEYHNPPGEICGGADTTAF
jgi:ELWxxDGT repeat protein